MESSLDKCVEDYEDMKMGRRKKSTYVCFSFSFASRIIQKRRNLFLVSLVADFANASLLKTKCDTRKHYIDRMHSKYVAIFPVMVP